MEAKHTPAPWHIRRRDKIVTSEHGCYEGGDAPATIAADGYHLATIRQVQDWQANARLMAAAPDLLAACRLIEECFARYEADDGDRLTLADCMYDVAVDGVGLPGLIRAAIAKAEVADA